MKRPVVTKSKVIFSRYGKEFIDETLQVYDGKKINWFYLRSPENVIIIPVTKNNQVVLVRLYRFNLKKYVYEFPAGHFEVNEKDPIKVARRELVEETGYDTADFVNLGRFYVLPGETNKWVNVVLAKNVTKSKKPKLDNVIEKYFDISIVVKNLSHLTKNDEFKNHIFESLEHIFALELLTKYLSKK